MATVTRQTLIDLLEPAVEALGYELSDLEYSLAPGAGLVRVFIDRPEGIELDDCERVSRQISGVLDVEDPIVSDYNLEVSSPGLDRKLVKPEHFDRFAGEEVKVRLKRPLDGRRRIRGELVAREEAQVLLQSDGETFSIPMADIDVARLVPKF